MIDTVVACTVCLGNADSPLLDAARIGVLVMGGVTLTVLAAFGRWVVRLARLAEREEQQPSTSGSH